MNEQLTRQGINYIIGKYAKMAHKANPGMIPTDFSPHKMRHYGERYKMESDCA
jgi:site-specific recombinase XerD